MIHFIDQIKLYNGQGNKIDFISDNLLTVYLFYIDKHTIFAECTNKPFKTLASKSTNGINTCGTIFA